MTFVAGIPLIAVIAALLLRQSALRGALIGAGLAAVIGAIWFDLTPTGAVEAAGSWWPLVVEVGLIVAGGIAFAEAGRATGAQDQLSGWLRDSLGTGIAPVLAIVHGVTPLAESLTGFGIGAVLAIPLLTSLGLDGRRSATIGLVGLCAVPWGSMGPGTLIAAQLGGVSFNALGFASGLFSLLVFVGVGLAAALLVAERGQRLGACVAAVASGLGLGVAILAANAALGTAPAGAVGAFVVLLVHLLISRARGGELRWGPEITRAVLPYLALLGGVVIASTVVRLTGHSESSWRYLASPALWLLLATVVGARGQRQLLGDVSRHTLRTWLPVGPATMMFIVLGVLMSISGMSGQIAAWLAGLGGTYLVAAPFIAGLGGFITGTNSGANAMFAAPQAQTFAALGADPLATMAAHNVSAGLLCMASPARVELAARLCPDRPRTTPVLRTLLVVDLLIVAGVTVALVMVA